MSRQGKAEGVGKIFMAKIEWCYFILPERSYILWCLLLLTVPKGSKCLLGDSTAL